MNNKESKSPATRSLYDLTQEECQMIYKLAFDQEVDETFETQVAQWGDGHKCLKIIDFEYILNLHHSGWIYAMVRDTGTPAHVFGYQVFNYLIELGVVFEKAEE
ncbi:hypothetical protein [Spirosoma litoris]